MTREQELLSLLAQFKELGIDKQIDYNKFYLYSLIPIRRLLKVQRSLRLKTNFYLTKVLVPKVAQWLSY